jgi:hypothetical protein
MSASFWVFPEPQGLLASDAPSCLYVVLELPLSSILYPAGLLCPVSISFAANVILLHFALLEAIPNIDRKPLIVFYGFSPTLSPTRANLRQCEASKAGFFLPIVNNRTSIALLSLKGLNRPI